MSISPKTFRIAGNVLILAGFALWAYGFVYGTFWYANEAFSYLEPVRSWVSDYTQTPIKPGLLEELFGLCFALTGMSFRIAAYYGKD